MKHHLGEISSLQAAAREPLRILGVDPGLNTCGYAVLGERQRQPVLEEAGTIRSDARLSLGERVLEIGNGLAEVLEEYRPQVLAIEKVFSWRKNPKSALMMAHVRGVLLFLCTRHKLSIVHYEPTRIKKLLTGHGRADKEQMRRAIQREFQLPEPPTPHDVADAMAIAFCHYHCRDRPESADESDSLLALKEEL